MGLDTVELVVSIEQAFGIQIPDDVAARLATPAQVIEYVHHLQTSGPSPSCLSQRAFYRLRSAFVDEGFCTRSLVRLDTNLEKLVPWRQRRRLWKTLKHRDNLNPPELERPAWLIKFLLATTLLISTCLAALYGESFAGAAGYLLGFTLLIGIAAGWATLPFAVRVPATTSTPALLVEYMINDSPKRFTDDHEPLLRSQIAATVRALTLNFCDESVYREDGHFVKDLGLD